MDTPTRDEDRLARDDPRWGWEFVLEDFVLARLDEDQARVQLLPEGAERNRSLAVVSAMRHALALHTTYVDSSRWNWGRCFTCEPVHGVPCATLRALALAWPEHPDLPYPVEPSGFAVDVVSAGSFRRAHAPATT